MNLANWKTSTGWCVDAYGEEDGRGNNQEGFSKEECFALCEKSFKFNGCTFANRGDTGICITYSGTIVGGNDNTGYQCFYRAGNQINFRAI